MSYSLGAREASLAPFGWLSYTKLMNLSAIQSATKKYGLLELDQAPQLASLLGLDLTHLENEKTIKDLIAQLGQIGAQHSSGLVVDPIYSFSLVDHDGVAGLLTRVTTLNEEVDPLVVPTLIPDYGLEELSENYSLAKLELYYHPQEEKALQKKQLLAEIHDYCDYLDIKLLLKLIIYTPAKIEFTQDQFQQDQLQAVQELRSFTDLIALQYPLTPLAAATVTAELDIPWILINQARDYEEFKQTLRASLENGAAGFMAGQSLWAELGNYKQPDHSPDLAKIKEFVQTTFQDRLIELMRIVKEGSGG